MIAPDLLAEKLEVPSRLRISVSVMSPPSATITSGVDWVLEPTALAPNVIAPVKLAVEPAALINKRPLKAFAWELASFRSPLPAASSMVPVPVVIAPVAN